MKNMHSVRNTRASSRFAAKRLKLNVEPNWCQKPPSLTGLSVGASLSRKNDAMPTRMVTPPATEKNMI